MVPSEGYPASVASSASNVQILPASRFERRFTVYNDSTAILYLLLSSQNASTTAYTVQIAAGGYYECPFAYSGQVNGIWASANGNARITEVR